jgi:3-hydroxy acid dehydrogenase/malonic semialdehyde reductase
LERLESLKQELLHSDASLKVLALQLDVRDKEAVLSLHETLSEDFRHVDILVNNAGLALGRESLDQMSTEDIDTVLETNINGAIYMMKAFIPSMKLRNEGHIINISSRAGTEPYPGGSIYCASKSALNALSEATRMDLVSTNIKVSTVSPGMVETDFSLTRYRGDASKASSVYVDIHALSAHDIGRSRVFIS